MSIDISTLHTSVYQEMQQLKSELNEQFQSSTFSIRSSCGVVTFDPKWFEISMMCEQDILFRIRVHARREHPFSLFICERFDNSHKTVFVLDGITEIMASIKQACQRSKQWPQRTSCSHQSAPHHLDPRGVNPGDEARFKWFQA